MSQYQYIQNGTINAFIFPSMEQECPYLPNRTFLSENFVVDHIDPMELDKLLALGYRHFGDFFFRPVCESCGECLPIRIPISEYQFSKRFKRIAKKGSHFKVTWNEIPDIESAFALYQDHKTRFDDKEHDDIDNFEHSFFPEMKSSQCICIYDGDQLIAVSHIDKTNTSVSSVYSYFDRRYEQYSPGWLTMYYEILLAKKTNSMYYYLGYYIQQNNHMNYKARVYPNEICIGPGNWTEYYTDKKQIIKPADAEKGFWPEVYFPENI
ncbi:MAG: GNAT family N-acetyltransferase [Spirochaetia bacterium]